MLWYSLLLTPSSCLIQPILFKFELTWDIKTTYSTLFLLQLKFSSTGIIFIDSIIFIHTFPDFVKYKEIYLLFTRMRRTMDLGGNEHFSVTICFQDK